MDIEFNYAGTAHHHLACTICWADTAQQAAGAIVQAWPLCPRALRQPYPTSRMWRHVQVAISSMGVALKHAHLEARASGDFGHGPSPQGSRLRKHLGGARKPHAVVLVTFRSCSSACVATLSTCSSAVTSNFAQARVRASWSAGRSLEQPACAIFSAEPAHRMHLQECMRVHSVHVQLGSHLELVHALIRVDF